MELLLIRHAEPIRIVDADGPANPHLHDRGRHQAARLGEWLAVEELHAVWSSPMLRAIETAQAVAAAQGLPVLVDEELAEFDREATSYIPLEDLQAARDERYLAMIEGRLEDLHADPAAFQAGVVGAIERVIERHAGQKAAVVCHGGVINAYMAHILGIERMLFFGPNYTSISRVLASSSGQRSVLTLNETAHLRRA
jgi:2,3-bisphosphoglycerate-dependent phosphoglycerate mutase